MLNMPITGVEFVYANTVKIVGKLNFFLKDF